ncbi:hypothetical protein OIV83_002426 [Microbotryomycetes sp. JL201]|nr:hypothetical protein OIV83_002426 [Microbotryomycetes sp. JL201]
MDDNPWGKDESTSPHPSPPLTTDAAKAPVDSSLLDTNATTWPAEAANEGADSQRDASERAVETDSDADEPIVDDAATKVETIGLNEDSGEEGATQTGVAEVQDDIEPGEPSSPVDSVTDSPPMTVPTLSMDTSLTEQGPPMDDFPDDDDDGVAPAAAAHFDDDDFDDFGEAAQPGDADDDFGDFGDFNDAPDSGAQDNFGSEPVQPQPQPPPFLPQQQSWTGYEPLHLDLTNTSRASIAEQLDDFFEGAYPMASRAVSNEPERQVEGVAQILVTDELRNLLSSLSSMPALRPLDWRRSRVRREHLVALGVPVNLDESFDAKPLASLVLPPINSSPAALQRSASPAFAGQRSASPASATVVSPGNRPPSRSSTPFADRERARQASQAPPLNRQRAEEACAIAPDELLSYSLAKLEALSTELDEIRKDASNVLTHALMAREKETSDAETYNEMIQDLVTAAAKVKTTTGRAGTPPIRSTSGKFGRR